MKIIMLIFFHIFIVVFTIGLFYTDYLLLKYLSIKRQERSKK